MASRRGVDLECGDLDLSPLSAGDLSPLHPEAGASRSSGCRAGFPAVRDWRPASGPRTVPVRSGIEGVRWSNPRSVLAFVRAADWDRPRSVGHARGHAKHIRRPGYIGFESLGSPERATPALSRCSSVNDESRPLRVVPPFQGLKIRFRALPGPSAVT